MHISCIIPSRNSSILLEEAIESVLSQTGPFELDEIIVVDDHSTDAQTFETYERISRLPGVRLIYNTCGTGPGSTRNYGVNRAKSPWICFLDADDVMNPASISDRIAALDLSNTGEASFVGGDFLIWYGNNHFEPAPFFSSRSRTRECLSEAFEKHVPIRLSKPTRQFVNSVLCHNASILIRKGLFTKLGGYEERLRFCEDHHFFIRLASQADFIFTPKITFWYRQHGSNMTRGLLHPNLAYAEALSLLVNSPEMSHLRDVIVNRLSELENEVACWHRQNARFREAFKTATSAIRHKPISLFAWKQLIASVLKIR